MRLQSEARTLHSNLPSGSNLTIHANAAAFKTLTANLYSNRRLAIVRELCSNEWDAHAMVGKEDTPIEVFTPNLLNSALRFRDYGPGLNHHDMLYVYTGVFLSTKFDSEIGGFGLGCKSPLSFTDQFTVISRHKGKKRTYSIYVDEGGMPMITMVSEIDSIEPSGLEVIVPTNGTSEDIGGFEQLARDFLSNAGPNFPAMLNGKRIEPVSAPYQFELPDYEAKIHVFPAKYGDKHAGKVTVKMGPVEYTTDILAYYTVPMAHYGNRIVVELPINKVEIAPSREQLSPTKTQQTFLEELAQALTVDLPQVQKVIRDKLATADSPWEMYKLTADLRNTFTYQAFESNNVTYKGQKIFTAHGVPELLIDDRCKYYYRDRTRGGKTRYLTRDYPAVDHTDIVVVANPDKKRTFKHHFQINQLEYYWLFEGTVAEAQKMMDEQGWPANVYEIEELSPKPKTQGPKGETLGTALYPVDDYDKYTAAQLLEMLDDGQVMILGLELPYIFRNDLNPLFPRIPGNHTKVHKALVEAGAIDSYEKLYELLLTKFPKHWVQIAALDRYKYHKLRTETLYYVNWQAQQAGRRLKDATEEQAHVGDYLLQTTRFYQEIACSLHCPVPDKEKNAREALEELKRVDTLLADWFKWATEVFGTSPNQDNDSTISDIYSLNPQMIDKVIRAHNILSKEES